MITKEQLAALRAKYPPGTRIELIHMNDPYNRTLKPGCRGSVDFIDDAGTLAMSWDCGSSLGLIPDEDEFRVVGDGGDG